MRRKLTWLVLLCTAVLVMTHYFAKKAWATPQNDGYQSKTLYKGTFADIDVFNHFLLPNTNTEKYRHAKNIWLSWQKTKGQSDLYIQQNDWIPGGSTGWHTHPGHSLIIVTAGTVTTFEGDDRHCRPHEYSAGETFIDSGGDHVHIIVNQGSVPAQTIAVQLVPAGQPRRIDADSPGNCPF